MAVVRSNEELNKYAESKAPLTGTGASGTWGISVSGNAATATKLSTSRTIGGVSFNGSADINLPGVNTAGNQDTTGNAATVTNGVYTIGDQTITGVKTFSSSPIVPTPTTGTQAVNKNYADLKVSLTDFTGANASLGGNGYQKLPSGLIIQWGSAFIPSGDTITLPITFPTANILVLTSVVATSDTDYTTSTGPKTVSGFIAYHSHSAPITIGFIAIGR